MTDYRYSIVPAAALVDPAIKDFDIRILALLGRHTNKNGWCRRSQKTLAAEANCVRSTIQASLDRLRRGGYVSVRLEGLKGRAPPPDGTHPYRAHSYRVLLDLDDQQIQRVTGRARKVGHLKNRRGVPDIGENSLESADEIKAAPGAEHHAEKISPDIFEDYADDLKNEFNEKSDSSARSIIEPSSSEPSPFNSQREAIEIGKEGSTASLAEFQAKWGSSAALDNAHRTMRAWSALSIEDRAAALAGIKPFKAELERNKRTHIPAGWRYLEERRWEALAITAGEWVDVKPLTRDWWAVLFHKIEQGKPIGAFLQYSLSNTRALPVKRDDMPTLEAIGRLEAYPSDGEVMNAWRPWLEARGVRVPARDTLWTFLPSKSPPSAGVKIHAA